jgi:thymidylate synthase
MGLDYNYRKLVDTVCQTGEKRQTRSGPTRALFGQTFEVNNLLYDEFPLLTTRQIRYAGVFGELAAFVRGATKIGDFKRWGCNYWDMNAKAWPPNEGLELEKMSIGQVYGYQWVNWNGTGLNQIFELMKGLQNDPHGRRHIVTSFNPGAESCLPPCHLMAQFYVTNEGQLDCLIYMRSVDLILGLPSDIALYAALLAQIAVAVNLEPGRMKWCLGDCHVYENHVETFYEEQYGAPTFMQPSYSMDIVDPLSFQPNYITIEDYTYDHSIKYAFNV